MNALKQEIQTKIFNYINELMEQKKDLYPDRIAQDLYNEIDKEYWTEWESYYVYVGIRADVGKAITRSAKLIDDSDQLMIPFPEHYDLVQKYYIIETADGTAIHKHATNMTFEELNKQADIFEKSATTFKKHAKQLRDLANLLYVTVN